MIDSRPHKPSVEEIRDWGRDRSPIPPVLRDPLHDPPQSINWPRLLMHGAAVIGWVIALAGLAHLSPALATIVCGVIIAVAANRYMRKA